MDDAVSSPRASPLDEGMGKPHLLADMLKPPFCRPPRRPLEATKGKSCMKWWPHQLIPQGMLKNWVRQQEIPRLGPFAPKPVL